jgi:TPR repeat protein
MTLLRGVTRSKEMAMRWMCKAAEIGDTGQCQYLAFCIYIDHPYAREVGHVGEAAGVAASAGVMEGHDVPPDVLTAVVGRCRLTASKPELKARLVSALETKM